MKITKVLLSSLCVLSLTATLAACSSDSSSNDKSSSSAKTESKKAESTEYFKDGVVKTKELQIKITQTKVIPVGQAGNEYGTKPVLAIWYDTTNLTDKELDPTTAWMTTFEAYQDTDANQVNKLDVGMLPDQQFLDTQTEQIKKDGTASNAVSYELDSDTVPVVLKAQDGLLGKKLGEQTINLQ